MNERETIDRGWFYVLEADDGRWAPTDRAIRADDGTVLTRRLHGYPARVEVDDASGARLPSATLLRAAAAVGHGLEARGHAGAAVRVRLGPSGCDEGLATDTDGRWLLTLDGPRVAALPSHHPVDAQVGGWLDDALAGVDAPPARGVAPDPAGLPARAAPRALFFESLMNTDMPHNDYEISQGVLHLISPLRALDTEVVLVNAKMPIEGDERPVHGLERLIAALETGPIHFIGITLLEGYWGGVCRLVQAIRDRGCRAHIAVGGVMPTLCPEHVAAHLPEVSFVCRGAGEYFVPRLARLVGDADVDTPWTPAQREAFLQLDGLLAIERAGPGLRLLAGLPSRTVQVDDLDRIDLDLTHVQPRHIQGGIEIVTSRGCIHKCSFCSILGRESYQARSAGSVFDVLDAYRRRFEDLFGDAIPDNSWRVHIADDDFACDRDRARVFFERLLETPFRLTSCQVAVGDLCRREGGRLLAEPDHTLLDAIRPECFADHGRPIPKNVFYEDHKARNWSSFLQIGVETYADREIARLGKGYKRVHVRTVVAELSRRGLHMDGYFILSNADTTAEDFVEVFSEVARLKLRFPEHFHMRFPVVQHLVSYFTAASHRRHVRRGRRHVMILRDHAQEPSHPEFDYPFVDHDEPEDPWVRRMVARTFVTDDGLYTANLEVLDTTWRTWWADLPADDPDRPRIARLLRRLDDRPRRLVFDLLRHAATGPREAWPCADLDTAEALDTAERVLGPPETWLPVFRAWLHTPQERALALVTAGPAGPASEATVREAVALLLSTEAQAVCLHLRQPGAQVDGAYLDDVIRHARAEARRERVALRVVLDAEGWPVDDVDLADVALVAVRDVAPPRRDEARRWRRLADRGAPVHVGLRLTPNGLDGLDAAVAGCLAAGAATVDVVWPARRWTAPEAARLGQVLFALSVRDDPRWLPDDVPPSRVADPHGVLVTPDGTITRADQHAPGEAVPRHARLGHLRDLSNLDRHLVDLGDPALRGLTPRAETARRAIAPARKVVQSFRAWRRRRRDPGAPEAAAGA